MSSFPDDDDPWEAITAARKHRKKTWRVISLISFAVVVGLLFLWSKWPRPLDLLNAMHGEGVAEPEEGVLGSVKWWECQDLGDVPGSECGYIIVPLDYLNASAGTAKVALGRYPATSRPRKGMVLFNPGGPGGSGKRVARLLGPAFQTLIGKDYDFVGFDPRGIGETEPPTNCFGTTSDYRLFKANTVLDWGFEVAPNLADPLTREHLIIQQQQAESLYKTQFELCGETMGDNLRYMGTSTVSRDIDFITTALEGKDALINFYGASYGSILGAYLVNMFPDRVGRVVIDGIVDPVKWASVPAYRWYRSWLGSTEDAYRLFLDGCSKAGPKVCALAEGTNEDPSRIENRLEAFFAELYSTPLAVTHADRPGIITSGRARSVLFSRLQRPTAWPVIASAFSRAMQGDGAPLLDTILVSGLSHDLERSAVSCNDNAPFSVPSAEEVIDEGLDVLKTVSRFGMSVVTTEPDSGCQFWPVTPPERFQGPWNHTLRNRILIHSNTDDPVTPITSGRLVKQLLGNSAALAIRQGPGHCSFSLASLCTAKVTQAYFRDGSLPPEGHICPVDQSPFPDPDGEGGLTGEDAEMLENLKTVGQVMAMGEMMDHIRQGVHP